MFASHDVRLIALAMTFTAACSTPDLDFPDYDGGPPGGGSTYRPPMCNQECQDYGVGLALADTIWLLYNQNIAGRPAPPGGVFDTTVSCPLGGSARITGTLSVSGEVTSVDLTYDLDGCANSDSFYELTFGGSVDQSGSFDGEGFTTVTFVCAELEISGSVMLFDDPSVDESCDVSVTQEEHDDEGTLHGRACGRIFSSETAFDDVQGGGGTTGGGANGGSGGTPTAGAGGSGGISTPGSGCPSVYDGTYIGQFAYEYETPGPMPMTATGSFNLTLTLACMAVADGQALLAITRANASHAYFGCGVGGCTPAAGSVAALPADPPTTPSSMSRAGHGLIVNFPNGVILGTANQAGALNVTSGGTTLSNSVTAGTGTMTWSAASISAVSAFPGDSSRITSFESWSLSKSGL